MLLQFNFKFRNYFLGKVHLDVLESGGVVKTYSWAKFGLRSVSWGPRGLLHREHVSRALFVFLRRLIFRVKIVIHINTAQTVVRKYMFSREILLHYVASENVFHSHCT